MGNGEILGVMTINNERKIIEKEEKNIQKRYYVGVQGHRSRGR